MLPMRSIVSTALLLAVLGGSVAYGAAPEIILEDVSAESPPPQPVAVESLSLDEAITRALETSPYLETFSWELRAADGRIQQAGLRPNPEMSFEIERITLGDGPSERTRSEGISGQLPFAGTLPAITWNRDSSNSNRGLFEESEFTLTISQVIERGQKRARRIALAESEKSLVQWDYETARANVIAGVAGSFVDVLAAQERVALHDELLVLAEDVVRTINARIEAGKVSPLDGNKADIALATTQIERDLAQSERAAACTALAAWWGGDASDFRRAVGQLDDVAPLPELRQLIGELKQNPDTARWTAEILQREAVLAVAQSQRRVDPTLMFGLRTSGVSDSGSSGYGIGTDGSFSVGRSRGSFDNSRDNTLILGISVPLPLFNRNQGKIAEAEALLSKGMTEERRTRLDAQASLTAVWENSAGIYEALSRTDREVLPKAAETFEKTKRGYREGKFSYLDVLDAQRTLFESRYTYLNRLADFHRSRVNIQRLTGRSLNYRDVPEKTEMTLDVIESQEVAPHE